MIFSFVMCTSVNCLTFVHETASTPNEILSNRVCGNWLGMGEDANVIISK